MRVDFRVVGDGAQARAAQAQLGVRIGAVEQIGVQARGQGVLAEVVQAQQGGHGHAAHSAAQGAFLGVEAIGPDALVAQQMQLLVSLGVVGFLKDGDVIHAAFVQVGVLVGVDGVDFHADVAEVAARDLHRLADVFQAGMRAAFAREDENFLHARLGDDAHLMLDFLHGKLLAADLVVAVETAVHAVVLAIVGDVERREDVDGVAEVAARDLFRAACRFFQEGGGGGGKQCLEVLDRAYARIEGAAYIAFGVACGIEGVHGGKHLVLDAGIDLLHAGQVGHMVGA